MHLFGSSKASLWFRSVSKYYFLLMKLSVWSVFRHTKWSIEVSLESKSQFFVWLIPFKLLKNVIHVPAKLLHNNISKYRMSQLLIVFFIWFIIMFLKNFKLMCTYISILQIDDFLRGSRLLKFSSLCVFPSFFITY